MILFRIKFILIKFAIYLMIRKTNIILLAGNYLFVSGEHRVHFNTNVCSRSCCTTHSFQAFGYPSLFPYMGTSVFILVFRRECVPNIAVYFKAISPITQPYRLLFSLHMYDTTSSFRISPCPLCSLLWIREYGTPQRSTLVCNLLFLCVLYVC